MAGVDCGNSRLRHFVGSNMEELPKYQREDGTTVYMSPTLAGTELHPHKARIRPEAVPLSKNFQMFVTAVKTI